MSRGFGLVTIGTGLAIILDESLKSGPSIISANEFECLVLSEMSRNDVVVLVLEYPESKIIDIGYPNAIVLE